MAHDIVKFTLALVVLIVVAVVVGMFVSGYLTAYKPGGKVSPTAQVPTGVSGGRAAVATPTPTPKPVMPQGMPYRGYQPASVFMPPEVPMGSIGVELMPQQQPVPQTPPAAQPSIAPATPSMKLWYYILQDLLRIFPGLFSGLQRAFPQWPVGWFSPG